LQKKGLKNESHSYHKGAYIKNINQFDYDFFGITPKEAEFMDPQQRLFLESAWMAIEDAGYSKITMRGSKTGIYLGLSTDFGESYRKMLLTFYNYLEGYELTGNINSIIASRISHILDFKGPSVVIDTACSSSLSALHYACMALKSNDCETAIVGSVKIDLLPLVNNKEVLDELGITSVRNRAVIFEADSKGTALGEGVGSILLKPLNAAIRDNDNIYAVIKGTSINNDGNSAGITAPNPQAQRDVLINAWENAGISPETLTYIEAHGTGTALGDPIEITGMQLAFSHYTEKKQFCAVGSVKGNIGHLDHAAGLAGLIKAILMLQHRVLPPINNFRIPNQNIDFLETSVYVNDRNRVYDCDSPMRCGISAFGLSGTNCHVVLEEIQSDREVSGEEGPYIMKASAKSKASLNNFLNSLLDFIRINPNICLGDMCFTLNTGRDDYSYRTAVVFQDINELTRKLESFLTIYHCVNCKDISKDKISALFDRLEAPINKEEKYSIFRELAEIYVSGANIYWYCLYQKHAYRRLSVPGYQFEKSRCWFSPLSEQKKANDNDSYQVTWKQADCETVACSQPKQDFLIFINDNTIDVEKIISMTNKEAIIVRRGNQYLKLAKNRYQIRSLNDYELLFQDIASSGINHIISVHGDWQPLDTEEGIDTGLYSLHQIVKNAFTSGMRLDFKISVITYNAQAVLPFDKAVPINACMEGFIKCIGMECHDIHAKLIDIDTSTSIDFVKNELSLNDGHCVVAYRNNVRYLRVFIPAKTDSFKNYVQLVRPGGTYLITGGYGALGLEIAKAMAEQAPVNLILTGRKGLPPRSLWDKHISKEDSIAYKIKKLQEIEKLGSTVQCLQADVADHDQMQNIFDFIDKNYKGINGIVHMAGNPGHGIAMLKCRDDVMNVVRPKIIGTMVLDSYASRNRLDFFVLFSSVTSFVAEAGQTDYASANCFLNSYAQQKSKAGMPIISICWPAWLEVGIAVENSVNFDDELFIPISPKKAVSVFFSLLQKRTDVIIPSFINNKKFYERQKSLEIDLNPRAIEGEFNLQSGQKKSDSGSRLFSIWKDVLGLEEFDNTESFHNLGGDSIMAIHMLKRVNSDFNLALDITDLFAYPSLNELTRFIDSHNKKRKGYHDVSIRDI